MAAFYIYILVCRIFQVKSTLSVEITILFQARRVFEIICPEEEFLPRAPEPEEIIFNDEGYNTEKNGSSSSESPEETNGDYEETEEVAQQEESATEDVSYVSSV